MNEAVSDWSATAAEFPRLSLLNFSLTDGRGGGVPAKNDTQNLSTNPGFTPADSVIAPPAPPTRREVRIYQVSDSVTSVTHVQCGRPRSTTTPH